MKGRIIIIIFKVQPLIHAGENVPINITHGDRMLNELTFQLKFYWISSVYF